MASFQRFLRKYLILIIVIIVIAVIAIAYSFGYRIAAGGIVRDGTLTLANLPAGTSVYTEAVLRTTTSQAGDANIGLDPGKHTVIVSAPNDFPWSTVISITSGTNTIVDPLLVGMNLQATPLSGKDLQAALSAISSTTLPAESMPLQMQNGCVNVYVSDNQLIENAATSTPDCTPPPYLCIGGSCAPTIVFSPVAPISSVFPYPGRQDAVAVSVGDTLYALSLDPTSPQFFAPLIRGSNVVKFGKLPDGTIVFQEGSDIGYKLDL